MPKVTPAFRIAVWSILLSACCVLAFPQNVTQTDAPAVQLSPEERAWLEAHPRITVFQDPGWPPIEFADDHGINQGITRDYLEIVEEALGIRFTRVTGLSWPEAYDRLRRHEIDMTTSVAITDDRQEFWAFTRPYMVTPIVYVTRSDVTYISDMRELRGKKIAVVDGYAVCDWIPRDYPGMDLVKVQTAREGLRMLARGEVFAFIENMLVAGYYISKLKLDGLKIAGSTKYQNAQAMAVRNDWAPLAGLLQKALDAIDDTRRDAIYSKWVPIKYEYGFDTPFFWRTLAALSAIIVALAAWIARMSHEVRKRKKAEAALAESENRLRLIISETPMAIIEWGLNMVVVDWNPGAERIFGYTKSEAMGRHADFIIPDDARAAVRRIWEGLSDKPESILSQNHNIDKFGRRLLCDWINTSLPDRDGTLSWVVSIVRDITKEREDEERLRAALDEKEILLRELFHRTKNNMNVISSFMQLQAMSAKNPELSSMVRKNVLRIQAMALAQEELYATKRLSKVDLGHYLKSLVENISRHYIEAGKDIVIEAVSDRVDVPLDAAIPCGLIVNELATNSFTHAFNTMERGRISIWIRASDDGAIEVRYGDDGVGLARGTDLRAIDSLGMVSVFGIAEDQLGAAISYESGQGLSWKIRFDPSKFGERADRLGTSTA